MRGALRLLAAVKPVTPRPVPSGSRYIEAGLPTGLTGLRTRQSPRSALLYLYNATLDRLKEAPETSLYRQSVENVTKQRLAVVESIIPEGWAQWAEKAASLLEQHRDKFAVDEKKEQDQKEAATNQQKVEGEEMPESFKQMQADGITSQESMEKWAAEMKRQVEQHKQEIGEKKGVFILDGKPAAIFQKGDQVFVVREPRQEQDDDDIEWDDVDHPAYLEGSRTVAERVEDAVASGLDSYRLKQIRGWDPEPQLTRVQVTEIENRIGAGLIEEVIEVAEGELKLADVMIRSKAWESLEEPPVEGQWTYFDRTN